MERTFCVGGPLDGKRVLWPGGRDYRCAAAHEGSVHDEGLVPSEFTTIAYVPHKVVVGWDSHWVLVHGQVPSAGDIAIRAGWV
jgi:hypothetical protein